MQNLTKSGSQFQKPEQIMKMLEKAMKDANVPEANAMSVLAFLDSLKDLAAKDMPFFDQTGEHRDYWLMFGKRTLPAARKASWDETSSTGKEFKNDVGKLADFSYSAILESAKHMDNPDDYKAWLRLLQSVSSVVDKVVLPTVREAVKKSVRDSDLFGVDKIFIYDAAKDRTQCARLVMYYLLTSKLSPEVADSADNAWLKMPSNLDLKSKSRLEIASDLYFEGKAWLEMAPRLWDVINRGYCLGPVLGNPTKDERYLICVCAKE